MSLDRLKREQIFFVAMSIKETLSSATMCTQDAFEAAQSAEVGMLLLLELLEELKK